MSPAALDLLDRHVGRQSCRDCPDAFGNPLLRTGQCLAIQLEEMQELIDVNPRGHRVVIAQAELIRFAGLGQPFEQSGLAVHPGEPAPAVLDTPRDDLTERLLTVILIVGVNGSGKTTTIAKLTHYYRERSKRVILAAADTFRAAAIDQLKIWGDRAQVDVIAHNPGADPGAVVYDAIQAAQSRKANILIVDTAGRLHTKYNLMQELKKVRGVMTKNVHRAPHETWLVLDATTGQNGLAQARQFKEEIGVTGLIVAKLDSTAKGGIVFAISKELALPIRFVCTGEGVDDLAEFDARAFVDGIFG